MVLGDYYSVTCSYLVLLSSSSHIRKFVVKLLSDDRSKPHSNSSNAFDSFFQVCVDLTCILGVQPCRCSMIADPRVPRMGSWVPGSSEPPFFRSKCRILLHFLKMFPGGAPRNPPPPLKGTGACYYHPILVMT